MEHIIKSNLSVLRLVAILFLFFWFSPVAFAQTIPASELDGYAWSSNIGWISLNCKTGGATGNNICGISNYKVGINADRTVTGYAWSSNIGWIKFGGLSAFPTGGGTTATNANVTGAYPNLEFNGWARACAGTNAPDSSESKDCSSMVVNDNGGGWPGWLSLRGTDTLGAPYSVRTSDTGFVNDSYAWGDQVIGWLDMSNVLWIHPGATLSVSNCTITTVGGSTCQASTTWNIEEATSPNVRNTTTDTSYSTAAAGTNIMRPLQLGSNTIEARDGTFMLRSVTASASCGTGLTPSGTTCITNVAPPVTPTVDITVARPIARVGDVVNVTWTINPSPLPAGSGTCTVSGPGLSGTVSNSGNQNSSALRSKSRFSITCVGTYGTVSDDVEIELIPTAQEV